MPSRHRAPKVTGAGRADNSSSVRPVEGPSLAASRTASQNVSTARTASGRLSFAKIREPLEVPNLLALQTDSFDWLLGNERWQARVGRRQGGRPRRRARPAPAWRRSSRRSPRSRTSRAPCRCRSATTGSRSPKYSIEECKERDITYSAPLFVTAEFMNNTTGEIKSQTVFMGDFPLMTEQGHLRHQRHRACRRLPAGPLARASTSSAPPTRPPTRTSSPPRSSRRRGAWLEFEIDKRDQVGVRVDRKRKQSVTVLLKALGWTDGQILEEFGEYESMRATLEKDHTAGQDDALLDIYRKLRPGEPPTGEAAQTLLDNLYFNPKRYDLAKVGRYKINKKLGVERAAGRLERLSHRRHRRDDQVPRRAARRRDDDDGPPRRPGRSTCASRSTTSTTSATAASAPSAS